MQLVERVIVNKLLHEANQAGWQAKWADTGIDEQMFEPVSTVESVIGAIESIEVCTITFEKEGQPNVGVLFIAGNGEDIISDYNINDDFEKNVVNRVYAWIESNEV